MGRDEMAIVYKLRRVLGALDTQQSIDLLLGKLRDTKTNVEFLLQVQKTTPGGLFDEKEIGRTV
jgi:transcription termination factor Rho